MMDGKRIALKSSKTNDTSANLDKEYDEHILSGNVGTNSEEHVDDLSEECIQELLRESPVDKTEARLWPEVETRINVVYTLKSDAKKPDFVGKVEGASIDNVNVTQAQEKSKHELIYKNQLQCKDEEDGTENLQDCNSDPLQDCNSDPLQDCNSDSKRPLEKTTDVEESKGVGLPKVDVDCKGSRDELEKNHLKIIRVKSLESDIYDSNATSMWISDTKTGTKYKPESVGRHNANVQGAQEEKISGTAHTNSHQEPHVTEYLIESDKEGAENDSDTDVKECITDVLGNIETWDNSGSSSPLDTGDGKTFQITDFQTISQDSKDKKSRVDDQDLSSCPSRGTSGASPNEIRIKIPTYVYSRQKMSPLDIDIPDMEAEETDDIALSKEVPMSQDNINWSKANYQSTSESTDAFLLTPSLSSEPEDFAGFENHTDETMADKGRDFWKTGDENKFLKVAYNGQNFFFKFEKLPESAMEEEEEENSLEETLQECKGCHFKMDNPTSHHECVPNFCVLCQVDASENFSLHLLEEHLSASKVCPFCREEMASLHQLEAHLEKHTSIKLRPSICISCKSSFKTLEGRIMHNCTSSCICKICNSVFWSEEKVKEHFDAQHKGGLNSIIDPGSLTSTNFSCNICDKPFATQFTLKLHKIGHFNSGGKDKDSGSSAERFHIVQTPQNLVKCPHCGVFYLNMKVLNDHLCLTKFCKFCLSQLSSKHEFEAHMVEYHCQEKTCQFCDEECQNTESLITHVKKHTLLTIRPYCCAQCESTFSKVENLENHKCQGKGVSTNPVCMTCKIYFQSEKAFETHFIKKHSCEYFCPVCKLDSSICSELLAHTWQEHSAEVSISFVCTKCDEAFKEESDHDTHACVRDALELHPNYSCSDDQSENECSFDDSRPLACVICGKEFDQVEALDEHIIEAVEEATSIAAKKHCSFCDVVFATRSSFESHMIQHHLSAMKCPFCLKYFVTKFSLEQHLLHHTNLHRNEFYCKNCRRIYFSQGLFQSHICLASSNDEESESDRDVFKCGSPAEVNIVKEIPSTKSRGTQKCLFCKETFASDALRRNHLKSHNEIFTCKICQQRVSGIKAMKKHYLMHFPPSRSTRSSSTITKIEPHMSPTIKMVRLKMPDEANKCLPCRRVFQSQEELNKHKDLVHSVSLDTKEEALADAPMNCKFCKIKLESHFWIAFHYTNQHNIMTCLNYRCPTCKVGFYTSQELSLHTCPAPDAKQDARIVIQKVPILIKQEKIDTEVSQAQASQEVVMHSLTKRGKQINHLQIDLNNLEHPCSHCKDVFVNQKSLLSHCTNVRYCLICQKIYKDKDKYEQHMMYVHANPRECTFCRQGFKDQSELIKHLKVHTKLEFRTSGTIKERVFSCRSCKATFKKCESYDRHNLEQHVTRHCPFCYKILPVLVPKKLAHLQDHSNLDIKRILSEVEEKKAAAQMKAKQAEESAEKKLEAMINFANANEALRRVGIKNKRAANNTVSKPTESTIAKAAEKISPKPKENTASKSSEKVKDGAIFQGDMCLICNKKLRSSALMYHHVLDLHHKNLKKCPFCNKSFAKPLHTKMHIQRIHEVRMIREEVDPLGDTPAPTSPIQQKRIIPTKKVASLESGSSSSKEGSFNCCICSKSCTSQSILDNHILQVHHMEPAKAQLLEKIMASTSADSEPVPLGPDKKTFCFHCHTSFNTPTELRAHGIKAGVFCAFCRMTLPDSNEYEMHMLEEHPSEDTCQFCGAYIPNKAGLEIHIRKHTKIGPIHYKCFGCNKMFTSSKAKDNHPCVAFACPKCGEEQSGPDGLENHLSTAHAGQQVEPEMVVVGDESTISAASAEKLGRKRKQDQIQPATSETSSKKKKPEEDSLSLASSLQKSEGKNVTSTVECVHCDRRFQNSNSLRAHASHYKIFCRVCKIVCPSPELLKEHEKTHVVEKPRTEIKTAPPATKYFGCRYCGEQCCSYAELREHHFSHVAFKCPKCGTVFDTKEQIMDHLKTCQKNTKTVTVIKEEESDTDSDIMIVEDVPETPQYVML